MTQIIDRRLNGKNKSAVNRQRFLRRYKSQIKKAVTDAAAGRSITDMENGERINIPAKDIQEPIFRHGKGGRREMIHPGNQEFVTGDRVDRPEQGEGSGGSKASKDGEGEDDFIFELSREEFMEFFFEDLELPDLVKTQLTSISEYKSIRAGYTTDGVPTNINVVRSLKGALARRIALRAPYKCELNEVRSELQTLEQDGVSPDDARVKKLLALEADLKRKIERVPFIDQFDLRYNNRVRQLMPSTQAVMFCIMDVSGSMDEERKEIAKRFFILLYLFLMRAYEKVQLVFIRHHTIAKEVDEDDFFHSRETGGTVVSSALELMSEIIADRYPSDSWNIYAAQASDGDNWDDDSTICRDLLMDKIMPSLQYFAYVEITPHVHQKLWDEYLKVADAYPNFAMQEIKGVNDIYPVFRELFKSEKVA